MQSALSFENCWKRLELASQQVKGGQRNLRRGTGCRMRRAPALEYTKVTGSVNFSAEYARYSTLAMNEAATR